MGLRAYYNEHDKFAAAWLRNLIAAGHIAPGDVDERSIVDVRAGDLRGYAQCHFFAGIGVWSCALRRAGWSDDRPVWTGSCPCQPFSAAGKQQGFSDERHLWPVWFELIRECRPVVAFGEQVASKDGLRWLDLVHADMEGAAYAVGAIDTCVAGFGAPHIRQRLYFVADSDSDGRHQARVREPATRGYGSVGNSRACALDAGRTDVLGNAVEPRLEGHGRYGDDGYEPGRLGALTAGSTAETGAVNGFWRNAEWIACRDGKARPVEPGTFPLAHVPARGVVPEQSGILRLARRNRVGRLRGYGNAIVAEHAAAFIGAYMSLV